MPPIPEAFSEVYRPGSWGYRMFTAESPEAGAKLRSELESTLQKMPGWSYLSKETQDSLRLQAAAMRNPKTILRQSGQMAVEFGRVEEEIPGQSLASARDTYQRSVRGYHAGALKLSELLDASVMSEQDFAAKYGPEALNKYPGLVGQRRSPLEVLAVMNEQDPAAQRELFNHLYSPLGVGFHTPYLSMRGTNIRVPLMNDADQIVRWSYEKAIGRATADPEFAKWLMHSGATKGGAILEWARPQMPWTQGAPLTGGLMSGLIPPVVIGGMMTQAQASLMSPEEISPYLRKMGYAPAKGKDGKSTVSLPSNLSEQERQNAMEVGKLALETNEQWLRKNAYPNREELFKKYPQQPSLSIDQYASGLIQHPEASEQLTTGRLRALAPGWEAEDKKSAINDAIGSRLLNTLIGGTTGAAVAGPMGAIWGGIQGALSKTPLGAAIQGTGAGVFGRVVGPIAEAAGSAVSGAANPLGGLIAPAAGRVAQAVTGTGLMTGGIAATNEAEKAISDRKHVTSREVASGFWDEVKRVFPWVAATEGAGLAVSGAGAAYRYMTRNEVAARNFLAAQTGVDPDHIWANIKATGRKYWDGIRDFAQGLSDEKKAAALRALPESLKGGPLEVGLRTPQAAVKPVFEGVTQATESQLVEAYRDIGPRTDRMGLVDGVQSGPELGKTVRALKQRGYQVAPYEVVRDGKPSWSIPYYAPTAKAGQLLEGLVGTIRKTGGTVEDRMELMKLLGKPYAEESAGELLSTANSPRMARIMGQLPPVARTKVAAMTTATAQGLKTALQRAKQRLGWMKDADLESMTRTVYGVRPGELSEAEASQFKNYLDNMEVITPDPAHPEMTYAMFDDSTPGQQQWTLIPGLHTMTSNLQRAGFGGLANFVQKTSNMHDTQVFDMGKEVDRLEGMVYGRFASKATRADVAKRIWHVMNGDEGWKPINAAEEYVVGRLREMYKGALPAMNAWRQSKGLPTVPPDFKYIPHQVTDLTKMWLESDSIPQEIADLIPKGTPREAFFSSILERGDRLKLPLIEDAFAVTRNYFRGYYRKEMIDKLVEPLRSIQKVPVQTGALTGTSWENVVKDMIDGELFRRPTRGDLWLGQKMRSAQNSWRSLMKIDPEYKKLVMKRLTDTTLLDGIQMSAYAPSEVSVADVGRFGEGRPMTHLTNTLKTGNYIFNLGFNFMSAFQAHSQMFIGMRSLEGGPLRVGSDMMVGIIKSLGRFRPEEAERLQRLGVIPKQYELWEGSTGKRLWDTYSKAMLIAHSVADFSARAAVFYAKDRNMMKLGENFSSEAERLSKAVEASMLAHFQYGTMHRPLLQQNPLGNLASIYNVFSMNYMNYMQRMWAESGLTDALVKDFFDATKAGKMGDYLKSLPKDSRLNMVRFSTMISLMALTQATAATLNQYGSLTGPGEGHAFRKNLVRYGALDAIPFSRGGIYMLAAWNSMKGMEKLLTGDSTEGWKLLRRSAFDPAPRRSPYGILPGTEPWTEPSPRSTEDLGLSARQ